MKVELKELALQAAKEYYNLDGDSARVQGLADRFEKFAKRAMLEAASEPANTGLIEALALLRELQEIEQGNPIDVLGGVEGKSIAAFKQRVFAFLEANP